MTQRINPGKLKDLLASKDEVTRPAQHVVEQLYQALVALPELRLPDGSVAKVEPYYRPELDEEGRVHCGIDVRMANGDLLEFTLKNTGWERPFAVGLARQTKSHPRQR